MPIATLLTDFGTRDYYVAAVKGVLLGLVPEATLVDVSHEVPPGAVREAAFLLAAAAPAFPAGTVHLAVVDPGVGSDRRILAAAHDGHFYVGPDNGLLGPALHGGEVRSVERSDLFRPAPGETFHGRDRFAPVAGHLLRGRSLAELGPVISDPVVVAWPPPRRDAGALSGRVVHVDRFGNLVTDIPSAWYEGQRFAVRLGDITVSRWAGHYAELAAGEPGLLPGSLGTLELSLAGESLAARCGIAAGSPIEVELS